MGKLEKFNEKNDNVKNTLTNIKKKNEEMDSACMEMEAEIMNLEEFIENANYIELTCEAIKTQILKPRDAVAEKIIHYQAKEDAIQDTLLQLKQSENLELGDWLKQIRKLSNKQFMSMVKK